MAQIQNTHSISIKSPRFVLVCLWLKERRSVRIKRGSEYKYLCGHSCVCLAIITFHSVCSHIWILCELCAVLRSTTYSTTHTNVEQKNGHTQEHMCSFTQMYFVWLCCFNVVVRLLTAANSYASLVWTNIYSIFDVCFRIFNLNTPHINTHIKLIKFAINSIRTNTHTQHSIQFESIDLCPFVLCASALRVWFMVLLNWIKMPIDQSMYDRSLCSG